MKRTSTKKLANRISYQIWYKGCLKGKFGRGVQVCEGGGGGSKSAVTPAKNSFKNVLSTSFFFFIIIHPLIFAWCYWLFCITWYIYKVITPLILTFVLLLFLLKGEKSSWKNTSVESHLSVNQPPEGVYDWFLELMFVLFSFLEALTCEQNMIGNWLQTMGLTALPLPGVAQREFLLIVAINCQAERQREESKLSTRRIVFDLIPHSLGLNYKKCTALAGRVWYHKLGLNWTNHDRMPALRSLCCVFVLP